MRAGTKFSLGLALVLLVAVTLGFRAAQSRREAEDALRGLAERRAGLASDVKSLEGRLAATERENGKLARELAALNPAKAASAATATARPMPKSQSEFISSDPKLEALSLKWSRAVVVLEYGLFFRRRGLTPEQAKKFEDLYVTHGEQVMDLRAVGRAQPDAAGQESVAGLLKKTEEEYVAAQVELLGRDGYRELQEYIRTLVVHNSIVLGLAGAAAAEGVPLSAAQGDRLQAAGVRAAAGSPEATGEAVVRAIDWKAFETEARQILSPAQFELLQNVSLPTGFHSLREYRLQALVTQALQSEAAPAR